MSLPFVARSLLATALGYLAGTFPSSDLAARSAATIDLRTAGSGNPGAANVANLLGARFGLVVAVADITKGVLAGSVGRLIAGSVGSHLGSTAAVIGHCHPVWTRFRGGKGVATSVGQVVATFPVYLPIDAASAFVASRLANDGGRAIAGTAVGSITWVSCALLWWRKGWPNLWGPKPGPGLVVAAATSSAMVILRFVAARPPTCHQTIVLTEARPAHDPAHGGPKQ